MVISECVHLFSQPHSQGENLIKVFFHCQWRVPSSSALSITWQCKCTVKKKNPTPTPSAISCIFAYLSHEMVSDPHPVCNVRQRQRENT